MCCEPIVRCPVDFW